MIHISAQEWYPEELRRVQMEDKVFGESKPMMPYETMPEITGMLENDAYLHELMINDHIEETIKES